MRQEGESRKLISTSRVEEPIWVFDVSCGIHASKSWVMGAPIR